MKKKGILIVIAIILIIGVILCITKYRTNKKINYEISEVETYNYYKYKNGKYYGVIDKEGNVVIEAEYESVIIPNPDKDIFICSYYDEEKNIVLNSEGEQLFSEYDDIEAITLKNIATVLCYEKSVLIYEKDDLYGLINFEGEELTKNIYTSIENLQSTEGKFLVCKDDKYGIVNLNGYVIIEPQYDKIETDGYYSEENEYIKSGFIVSTKTDDGYKYGYINYKGKVILEDEYNEISRIKNEDEIYLIASSNGQYGLYKKSKEIIAPEYQSMIYTDNGALIIQKNTNYGIANIEGKILVETKYSSITEKGIYLYAETTEENSVYDTEGNLIDINYNKAVYETENEEYRIVTLTNNDITYYGIENKDGTSLVSANYYRYIEYAYGDYFIAKNDEEKLGVITSSGKIVIKFYYDSIQRIKEKNMIQTLITDVYDTEIYSSTLELVCTMNVATVNNYDTYIKIYNYEEAKYFDSEGNEISEDSEIIVNNFPEEIGDYIIVQEALDDVYYE